ncbi:MAG TPA: RNA polymerase factor sigma-54 [Ktedonobacteraceae bacterium]|nr:RNA polymerase factor sigma-54 [Ktedonobacteraceae bacterium]
MRLEPTQKLDHVLRVSAKLITSSTILHLSSDELERAVNQEQIENPALEVSEHRICLFCGMMMQGQSCSSCGHFAPPSSPDHAMNSSEVYPSEMQWSDQFLFSTIDAYGIGSDGDEDDDFDPVASIPTGETLVEVLLQQLEALVTPEDAPIAEQLVGNLNERGYLDIGIGEVAEHLHVPVERVEYVLSQLQTLEPLGIGARDLRECLLIQLQALSELEELHPLAYPLIEQYLDLLGRSQFAEIARLMNVQESDVRQASLYIRRMLHPYPAHIYRADTYYSAHHNHTTYMRPDIIIRKSEAGFEVELIEEKRYRFSISRTYATGSDDKGGSESGEEQHYLHHQSDRARFFVECVQRRWQTLRRVAEMIVEYQREFLEKGVRYLRPLTRAEVAARLGLDEGTISRATANKYALLPNGRLIPISDFFDGSLGIKDILRELILSENPKRRYSDDELARLLSAQGIPIARRTVTKYREEMGIGSSRERG